MIVYCQFNQYSSYYQCNTLKQVIPVSNDQMIFQGEHADGKCNDDVERLFFNNGTIFQIPQTIGDSFKNIETLSIIKSKLKSITKYDLKQFKNLKELNLNNNELEFLPGDLFEFTKKLEEIYFNDNKIKFIGPALLDDLPHLKTAEFASNVAIDNISDVDDFEITLDDIKQDIQTHCKPPYSDDEMHKLYDRNPEKEEKLKRLEAKINFLDDIQELLALDDYKDFTIKVGDRDFKVHKLVFAARSKTFAELIKNNPEAEDLVLQDISVEVFECILSYVYSDQQPDTQNIHEVFAAAGKLKIIGLMNISAQVLINSMENETNLEILFQILSFANKFEHAGLRLKAFEEIKKHFPSSQLKDELACKPEKLKKIIETKLKLEDQLKIIIEAKLKLEQQLKDLTIDDDEEEEEEEGAVGGEI